MTSIKKFLENKSILITGGTGSFGKKCIETLLSNFKLKKFLYNHEINNAILNYFS